MKGTVTSIRKKVALGLVTFNTLALSACDRGPSSEERVLDTLRDHPEVLVEIMKNNPRAFLESFQYMLTAVQSEDEIKNAFTKADDLRKKLGTSWRTLMGADEVPMGTPGAPFVLMMFSDFECPYCLKGYTVVKSLMDKYPGQIQLVYRHYPLDFHEQAMPAARYYEALRLQNPTWAAQFYDGVFQQIERLDEGAAFFEEIAGSLGADLKLLSSQINGEMVSSRIAADKEQTEALGFSGTPAFLLNGIPIEGAHSIEYFEQIMAAISKKEAT